MLFIFLRVARALVLLCCISAFGMRAGIIVLYFPRVQRALLLLCYIFRACNAIWYFGLNSFRVVIYLPCDFTVSISKLSLCKGVEFSAVVLAFLVNL